MFTVVLYIKAYARLHPQTSSAVTAFDQISFFFISFSGQNEIKSTFFQTHYILVTAGIFNLHYPGCCEGQISFDLNYLEKGKKKNSPQKDSHKIPDWVYLALFSLRKGKRTSRLPAYAWPWLGEEVPERKRRTGLGQLWVEKPNFSPDATVTHAAAAPFIPAQICIGD